MWENCFFYLKHCHSTIEWQRRQRQFFGENDRTGNIEMTGRTDLANNFLQKITKFGQFFPNAGTTERTPIFVKTKKLNDNSDLANG
jgi:hypothetical protein